MRIFVKLVCFFHVLRFKKSCLLLYELTIELNVKT